MPWRPDSDLATRFFRVAMPRGFSNTSVLGLGNLKPKYGYDAGVGLWRFTASSLIDGDLPQVLSRLKGRKTHSPWRS
jgi:hypothetical protein